MDRLRFSNKKSWKLFLLFAVSAFVAFLLLKPSPYLNDWFPVGEEFRYWVNNNSTLRNLPFFGAAGLMIFTLYGIRVRVLLLLLIPSLLLEFAQLFIPTRYFQWGDVFYTILGVMLAWVVVKGINFFVRNR